MAKRRLARALASAVNAALVIGTPWVGACGGSVVVHGDGGTADGSGNGYDYGGGSTGACRIDPDGGSTVINGGCFASYAVIGNCDVDPGIGISLDPTRCSTLCPLYLASRAAMSCSIE